jgi:putative isomerase
MPLTADRHWGTWSGDYPTALVHLPSGLGFRFLTYSGARGRVAEHRDAATVRYLQRSGSTLRFALLHAGSVVDIEVAHVTPFDIDVRARLVHAGEWSLRFWLLLAVGRVAEPTQPRVTSGPMGRTDVVLTAGVGAASFGMVDLSWRSTAIAVRTLPAPARSGTYVGTNALRDELESGGYYYPHDDVENPDLAVLRFSGQEQGEVRVAVSVRNSGQEAARAAEDRSRSELGLLRSEPESDAETPATSDRRSVRPVDEEPDAATAAVRDVIGWNTVWDPDNSRIYTTPSREWLAGKFGTYGIWLTDVAYAGLLAAAVDDYVIATANIRAAIAGQQPAGNLAGLLTTYEEWVDRSQPPVVSFLARRVLERSMDRSLLDEAHPVLARSHAWWWTTRDPAATGLVRYGSTLTGRGTFRHTKQGALNESAMDNLPMFDTSRFDPATSTLDVDDPGLNSLLVLDAQSVAVLARLRGQHDEAAALERSADAHADRIRERLWDTRREIFAARRGDGTWIQSLSPTSFLPLVAGVADAAQAEALIERHLLDAQTFWGARPLPASSRDDPASADRVYWRGRIWPPLVYLVYEGLVRSGHLDVAEQLADRAWDTFAPAWSERLCLEHFDPDGPDQDFGPDVDPFYTWGALLPLLRVLHRRDVSPWLGTVLDASQGSVSLIRGGQKLELVAGDGSVELLVDGKKMLRMEGASRLHDITVSDDTLSVLVPRQERVVLQPLEPVVAVNVGDRGWNAIDSPGDRQDVGPSVRIDRAAADRLVRFLFR